MHCCSVAKSCPTLCNPMDGSTAGLSVPHHLQSSPKSTESLMLSSAAPFPQSFPASGSQSIGASASASVLPMNIQGWFPLGRPGSPGLSESSQPLAVQVLNLLGCLVPYNSRHSSVLNAQTLPTKGSKSWKSPIYAQGRDNQLSAASRLLLSSAWRWFALKLEGVVCCLRDSVCSFLIGYPSCRNDHEDHRGKCGLQGKKMLLVPTLWDLMDYNMPAFTVLHHLPEFAQTRVHSVSDSIQPSHPLSCPSPPALNLSQHQGLF